MPTKDTKLDDQAAAAEAAAAAAAAEQAAAEAAAAAAAAAAALPTKTISVLSLRAAHGLLIHPYTKPEVRFEQGQVTEHVRDTWVEAQIEGGKLVVVG